MPEINLHHGECLAYMRTMPDNSVDAIVTDPPYFGVKDEAWDNQWKDAAAFIEWIGELSEQWQRILRPNGSLYCFASPRMAARVEVKIAERFEVLQNIVWNKPNPGRGGQSEKEALRNWWPTSERIIFAEHYGADNMAKGEAGYAAKCDELRGFIFEPLRAYIVGEFERAGLDAKKIAEVLGVSKTMVSQHYLSSSQWGLPTAEKYNKLREYANRNGGEYLGREYEDLRREYEDLRREYEDLRREYEDLRRPFNVTSDVPYTDVWTFKTVQAYDGKHVCEKPLALMEHIILASTRPGAIVFDPFMGSGSTGHAAVINGRSFVGCEMDADHFKSASQRINNAAAQTRLFT
jgi:site-specific DNA-methyltransferase (adenine-specific)